MGTVFKSIKEVDVQQVKWIDARFSLQDKNAGKKKYKEGHIKGAVYWDLEDDLSDMNQKSGRHPLPDHHALTSLFRNSGLHLDDEIIVYDDGGSPFAARAWWILQYAGFENSFIALEGYGELLASGTAMSKEIAAHEKTDVVPMWDEQIFASRQFVENTVAGKTGNVLLDARSAERYRGEIEPIDPVAGHIPGALNFDWEQLKKDGTFDISGSVRDQLSTVVSPQEEVTVYCGSGVTAAPMYAMLKESGYKQVRLYVGSYSDWISREEIEVEKS